MIGEGAQVCAGLAAHGPPATERVHTGIPHMIQRFRLLTAGVAAFLLGVPLAERASGQTLDVIFSSLNLAGAIADSAGRS